MRDEIKFLAEVVGQASHCEQVYLFGSEARGDAHLDSDVDLALIIPDGVSPRQALRAAIRATAQRSHPIDLVVIAHSTWANGQSLLARQIRQEGVLVYEQ